IINGIAPSYYVQAEGQYLGGLAMDPNSAASSRLGGHIAPVKYTTFSGSNVTGSPNWLITNPKNNKVYAYMSDGKFVSYSSVLASETLVGTPTSGAGNGAAYYNNYIYLFTPTDTSR